MDYTVPGEASRETMAMHRRRRQNATLLGTWQQLLREHMPELRERFGVASLGMFGSHVRGNARPASDLDLLVEFSTPPSLLEYLEVEEYLSHLLGVKVDLVHRDGLKPRIGESILREVVVLSDPSGTS